MIMDDLVRSTWESSYSDINCDGYESSKIFANMKI